MNRFILATSTAHSLIDIDTLPWWVQLLIGLALLALASLLAWLGKRTNACAPSFASLFVAVASLAVIWDALFGDN